jgi:hypothetical protein
METLFRVKCMGTREHSMKLYTERVNKDIFKNSSEIWNGIIYHKRFLMLVVWICFKIC